MKMLLFFRSAAAVMFHREHFENEMDEELRSHIRQRGDDLVRSGMQRSDAERQARVEFGGYEHYKEECRESAGAHFMDVLKQDVGFALRLIGKSPGFAIITVLTLALAIGANTSIFSLTNAVLLRPLPYAQPEQLVLLFENNLGRGVKITGCSYQDMLELRNSDAFSAVGGVNRHALTLTGAGNPAEVDTVVVTPEIFPLLGAKPLLGRYLFPEDENKGAAPAVIVSERLWRGRFGANPGLVGSSMVLDQKPFTVVGIMPAGFRVPVFGERQDIWVPVAQDPLFSTFIPQRGGHWLRVIGRLNPRVTLARSKAEADAISARLAKQFPLSGGWSVQVAPLQKFIAQDVKTPLLVLLGAVGLVLVLGCVNIANLLLARATARTRELAVRRALGAERGRLIRQLFTESVLLGLAGAAIGVALAYASARALPSLLPPDLPAMQQVRVDWRALGFAMLLSLTATVAFGIAPALLATSSDLQSNLRDSAARSGSGAGRLRARRFLAAAEIGLAAVLVICAGLLVRSLLSMTAVDPGFRVQHILKAEVSLPRFRYSKPEQWVAFSRGLLERIHSQPGLANSALAVPIPLGDGFINLGFSIPDHPALPPGMPETADYVSVSPEYFHVMGIPLLRGRRFGSQDVDGAPATTIISESFARLYFRGEDPIGKKLKFGFPPSPGTERMIVGVVGNVRDSGLTQEPGPMMYVPFEQAPVWGGDVVVDTNLPVSAATESIRKVVRGLDKDLPVTRIVSMPEVIATFVAQPKIRTSLLSAFGLVALALAALGVFGVLSYSVASRMREFGIRAALGASPRSIGKMILLEGLMLGSVGLVAGLIAAAALVRFLRSELYGVAAYDPATFLSSIAILLSVAVLACYLPARRAMAVDPIVALRVE